MRTRPSRRSVAVCCDRRTSMSPSDARVPATLSESSAPHNPASTPTSKPPPSLRITDGVRIGGDLLAPGNRAEALLPRRAVKLPGERPHLLRVHHEGELKRRPVHV